MEQLFNDFDRISAIIESNRNCLHHKEPLLQLIRNFYKIHTNSEIECEPTVDALSHVLYRSLKKKYNEL